jgi:hypothetical protein
MKLSDMAAKNRTMHKMKRENSRPDEQDSQDAELSAIADGVNGTVKIIRLREDFDRGMIDRGIMARPCLFPIPLSIIPLSTAFPGKKDVCQKNGVRKICGSYISDAIFLPSSVRLASLFCSKPFSGCGWSASGFRRFFAAASFSFIPGFHDYVRRGS